MSDLYVIGSFLFGVVFATGMWAFLISRDNKIVHLQDDEVVIKRPNPDLILVQVTPDVARRLVSTGGELEVPKAQTEARALYPERSMNQRKKQLGADPDAEL